MRSHRHNARLHKLGTILRMARLRRNLRLRDVAPAVGISLTLLHGYETGCKQPPSLRLFDCARILGLDMAVIAREIARPGRPRKAA